MVKFNALSILLMRFETNSIMNIMLLASML